MSETIERAKETVEGDLKGAAPKPAETLRRLVQGDLASLRVVIGLALIWAIFQFENSRFLSAENLTNLGLQITAIGLISVGIVYVLLLGEIDLSVGAISGLAAACMAVLNVKHGWNPYLAIAAAVAVGCAIGLLQGSLFTRFGIPSFVVTLAGLLAWQGALLQVLGSTGSLNITDPKITGLANTFYSDTVGWILLLVGLVSYGAVLVLGHRSRIAAGLAGQSPAAQVVRFVGVAAVAIAAVLVFNSDRGVPLALLILLGFVIGMEFVVKRTGFGRHVFAVGGNAEAARRAGIRVNGVRIAVFAIAGTMAAIGGIMAASRLLAVNQNSHRRSSTWSPAGCCYWP
jgi:D-xylose transport system permease protein